MAVVAKTDSGIKGFADLKEDLRIGVVQGTVQDDYVTNTLKLEPIRFPDYATVYANVRNGQVDAWVAPSQQATGQVKEGDGTDIVESVVNTQNFTAYAVAKDNQPLIDALNSGLDAVIADGNPDQADQGMVPGPRMPTDWKPGSKRRHGSPELIEPGRSWISWTSWLTPSSTGRKWPKSSPPCSWWACPTR